MINEPAADGVGPFTGRRFLATLLGCFAVVFTVNILMAYYAVSTFRGETDPSPYEHGLAYEKDILAAKAQDERAWKVTEHFDRDARGDATIEVSFRDRNGSPVERLAVTSGFDSPADMKLDRDVTLKEVAPGVYAGGVDLAPGQWDVELEAGRDGGRLFKSVNRVSLR